VVTHFFDKEITIADLKSRKEMKPQLAKKRDDPFSGRLIVLVDSNSGSASELFARVMQIEKRGTVLGDQTAGAVMTAKYMTTRAASAGFFTLARASRSPI